MVGLADRILENCDYLREEHHISKTEFEKSCGVGAGYFSRLRKLKGTVGKRGKGAQISLPVSMKISENFNLSLNALTYVPLQQLDATQLYLVKFLDKLSSKTREEKTSWEFLTEPEFRYPGSQKGKSNSNDVVVFKSNTYGEKTSIAGRCYSVVLPNGISAYLVKICDGENTEESAIEMWFTTNDKRDYICGPKDSTPIAHMLEALYNEVRLNMEKPHITDEMKNAIDDFMRT